jgi:hypothetical protein
LQCNQRGLADGVFNGGINHFHNVPYFGYPLQHGGGAMASTICTCCAFSKQSSPQQSGSRSKTQVHIRFTVWIESSTNSTAFWLPECVQYL